VTDDDLVARSAQFVDPRAAAARMTAASRVVTF
jgi:hypothetical protein